ncbi:non-specific phospholipase C6 isoform X2 [Cryptomeria japonica]|uniref:non-specific phospholipase C6 isoform X2 n=1 Tax=Cryptomeria japonica TaxID=3369 RepID=UPI0025ABC7A8|nr:non-specific phospholipase C6 isoform X2 [Cryptomeria japonica]
MKVFSRQKHKSFLNLFLVFLLLLLPSARSIDGPIKTIVVLVMENRSFDHMVGWMKRLNSEINGVTGQESNPVSTTEENSLRVYFKDDARFVDPDPGHMFESVREQVFGSNLTTANPPPMNGFVQNALSISKNLSETVMKGLKPELIPIYTELVKEFAIFDRWFSSLPGPTHPNRLFVYSGTSHGATSHIAKQLAVGYPQKTIFESLHESGLSFGIYYQNIPATLFYRNLRKLKYIPKFHHYGLKFKRHARKGKLPNLTVIEPRYFDLKLFPANDDHPAHDLANGQKLVKEVYETLRQSPQWNETLFVLTYDEHGGFYDHVPTPVRNVPSPDGIVGPHPHFFKFDRLGVRVPTIMISPWITKGTVVLPEVKALRESPANETGKLSEFQKEMVQLAAVINGDHILKSYPDEIGKRMNVREANAYVEDAMSRFVEASMEAIKMGAPDSTIVEMRPSLTTRNP